jgi:hypothetical protein
MVDFHGIAIATLVFSFIDTCYGALPIGGVFPVVPYPSASSFVRRGAHWSHVFGNYLYVSGGEIVWQNETNRLYGVSTYRVSYRG